MVSHRRVCLHNSTVTFVMLQGLGDSALFISERVGIHITAFGCCPTLVSCFYFVNAVYNKHNYLNTIRQVAKDSMQQSIFKALDAQPEDDNRVSMFVH